MSLNFLLLINDYENNITDNIIVFLISLFSNIFSAICGGGAGLIQLPALILSGIPYSQALVAHKIATVALGVGGSLRNQRNLRKDINVLLEIIAFGTPGIIFGTSIIEFISKEYLYLLLGFFQFYYLYIQFINQI